MKCPEIECIYRKGKLYEEARTWESGWLTLGLAPTPNNRWRKFWYHFHHGCIMRYPLWNVIWWSVGRVFEIEWLVQRYKTTESRA